MLVSVAGCVEPAAIPDACTWLKPVIVDPGFETRLTDREKDQILTLDEHVEKYCR